MLNSNTPQPTSHTFFKPFTIAFEAENPGVQARLKAREEERCSLLEQRCRHLQQSLVEQWPRLSKALQDADKGGTGRVSAECFRKVLAKLASPITSLL